MKVLVTGATGLVGSNLIPTLRAAGHTPVRLIRRGAHSQPRREGRAGAHGTIAPVARLCPAECQAGGVAQPRPAPRQSIDVVWDPSSDRANLAAMAGADAVIHLAGASIASSRWTPAYKRLLRSSRIEATRHLVAALARLEPRPGVLIAASAVGIYGNRADEVLTDTSPPGDERDFLARLARDWETESRAAESLGMRVVLLRFGMILDSHGGALPRLLLPFRLGLGGPLGSGRQWMSWITLPDVLAVIQYALAHDDVAGPVNAVAPEPVTNRDFTRTLARHLHRPALLPAPAFALRLALGEMADALLLASQRAVPDRLQRLGFAFRHPTLADAFAEILA